MIKHTFLFVVFLTITCVSHAEDDILIADFDGEDYGDWKVEGKAFGDGPAKGKLGHQQPVTGFQGKGLVNSFFGGDPPTGALTSPVFTIERDYLTFLIGGGGYAGKTCVNLLVEGKAVRTATGPNTRPGGSEFLRREHWDVEDLKGREAIFQIVDHASGTWGHINVDQIIQSDTLPKNRADLQITRELEITGNYLLVPVKNGGRTPFNARQSPSQAFSQATIQILDVFVEGMLVHSPNIYLAHRINEIDWWANLDMSQFVGKKAKLRVRLPGLAAAGHMPGDSRAIDLIESSDAMRNLLPQYSEPMRPKFHFSQRQGWNNDTNGMVYYDGEYHLFWQCNPVGKGWDNMYWGHAVSPNMIHWRELRPALRPHGQDVDGKAVANRHPAMAVGRCHSGSGHVDLNNSAGFQTSEDKTIVLAYTDTGEGRARTFSNFTESIAYSTDRGRTWRQYEGNPVIRHLGRDPKLFWYEPGEHWTMAVYDEQPGSKGIAFYKSTNLKQWERTGKLDGFYECPEVFCLPVDPPSRHSGVASGDPGNRKWVVFGGDAHYVVGQFDGKDFEPEHEGKHRFIYGSVYAGQCFSNPPDGRVVYMGWAKGLPTDGAPYSGGFTLPLNLTLHDTPDGVRMRGYPIDELDKLHKGELFTIRDRTLTASRSDISFETQEKIADICVTVKPATGAKTVSLSFSDGAVMHKLHGEETVSLRVIIDRPMYEIFLNRGETYTLKPRSGKPLGTITLHTEGVVEEFTVHGMKSIWIEE